MMEALRLFPPLIMLLRQAKAPFAVTTSQGKTHVIPKVWSPACTLQTHLPDRRSCSRMQCSASRPHFLGVLKHCALHPGHSASDPLVSSALWLSLPDRSTQP